MRTYSTPQSALNGELTKIAIIECVASVALYISLSVYLGTFKYLAGAVLVAPFMLFRTEYSADWGLQLYTRVTNRVLDWTVSKEDQLEGVRVICALAALALIGTVIRVVATVYWTFRRPLQTLRDTPQNWMRQALCTDIAHPPEIVPKESLLEDSLVFRFAEVLEWIRQEEGSLKFLPIIFFSPLLLLGWLPSVVYRSSFKATALVYIPFVWIAHSTLRNPLPLKARLERFTKGELEKVRRGVSYLVLITLVAKGALVFNWIDRAKVEAMYPSQKIVTDFVVLDAWPWWQITFGADALLTFALLYFADAALSRIEAQRPWREESVMTTVAAISFLRAIFALITIAHFFRIALLVAAPAWAHPLLTF